MNFINHIRHSFPARISLYIIAIVNTLFVIAFVVIYVQTSHSIKDISIKKAEMEIEASAFNIERELAYVSKNADNIKYLFQDDKFQIDSLSSIMRGIVENNDIIVGAGIFFESDFVKANNLTRIPYAYRQAGDVLEYDLTDKDFKYHDKDWYLCPKLYEKGCWTDPFFAEMGLETLICTYTSAIYDHQGEFIGVVAVDISLNWLNELGTFFNTYPNSVTIILDKHGDYIVHTSDANRVNTSFFDFAKQQPDSVEVMKLGNAMINGQSGYIETISRKEVSYVFYRPIEKTSWSIAMINNQSDILSGLTETMQNVATCGVLALLLTFVLCIFIIRRISKPIVHFAESAKKIAHGDFNAELPEIKSDDEMRELHDSFEYLKSELVRYIASLEKTILSKEKIESELRIAHSIQMGMIPKIFPPFPDRTDVDLYAVLKPAREVGGDLYDFFIKDESLYFTIGDVSGKGIPASLFMAVARSLFRSIADKELSPKNIVQSMNDRISENNEKNMFITLFVGVLNLKARMLTFCNAGHNPPCVINARSEVSFMDVHKNIPVGIFQDFVYEEQTTTINKDETLFLYTDGLTEAENAQRELFGDDRMFEALASCSANDSAQTIIQTMHDSVIEHVKETPQSDDLTILTIKYNG